MALLIFLIAMTALIIIINNADVFIFAGKCGSNFNSLVNDNDNNGLSYCWNIGANQQQQSFPVLLQKMENGMALQNRKPKYKLPHILLVVLDDVGFNDMGKFSKYAKLSPKVPYLEQLMENGVRLTSFYAQAICSPTRGALMTGRYPIRWRGQHSVSAPIHPTWVPEDETFLPELLQEVGYYTAATGKWHLGHSMRKYSPVGRGFNEFYGPYMGAGDHWNHTVGKYLDLHHDTYIHGVSTHEHIFDKRGIHSTKVTEEFALKIIEAHDETNDNNPLFLYMPFQAPHMPTQDHQEYIIRNMHIQNNQRRRFAGMVSHIDDTIRQVVEKLKSKNNMWENTFMILFADNGGQVTQGASNYPLRGTKSTPWEGGTRVPAFLSGGTNIIPDSVRGTSFTGLAHVTDILPTIREMLLNKIKLPQKRIDGISFWSSLISGKAESNRKVMLYALDPYKRLPLETMRSRREALKEMKDSSKFSTKKVLRDDFGMTNAHAGKYILFPETFLKNSDIYRFTHYGLQQYVSANGNISRVY